MRFLRAQTYEVRVKELREQLAAEQRELAERTRKFELEVSYSYAVEYFYILCRVDSMSVERMSVWRG